MAVARSTVAAAAAADSLKRGQASLFLFFLCLADSKRPISTEKLKVTQ
jgi:hypothetical protein